MLTDVKTTNLRVVLHQIWATLYVEYVVKNPLSPIEHPGGVGVNNELFELGLDRFVVCFEQQRMPFEAWILTAFLRHRSSILRRDSRLRNQHH